MPRNGSGVFSLSGANFPAVPATLIESTKYNANLNDVAAALTQSVSADGQTTITNNLPMNNNKLTGLAAATAAGDAVRFNQLQKGSDIAVTASSTVAIPAEGPLFNLTAASAFNVTGFTGGYDGRTFGVRFNPDKLLTIVNSSTFKLLGGTNRITRAGEIIWVTQESAGVIAEIGQQPLIDLTGYSGADVTLGIGQSAIYDVSAVTSLLLRIATGDNQFYDFEVQPTIGAGIATGAGSLLSPNNTSFAGAFQSLANYQANSTPTSSVVAAGNTPIIDAGFRVQTISARCSTKTISKSIKTHFVNSSNTTNYQGTYGNLWNDTTTVWSSLGTLTFANAITGRVMVKRVM